MKKIKNGSKWNIEAMGLSFDLEFKPVSIEKMTGFFIPEGKSAPQFSEYITSIDMELLIRSNIGSELDDNFELRVMSDEFYMDTEDDRYIYEVSDEFDGDEEDLPLYMYAPENVKKSTERIWIVLSFSGTTIFEKCFLIDISGKVEECLSPNKIYLLEHKE